MGLMKRLFHQIPARDMGEDARSDSFHVKLSNFYFLMQQRVRIKSAIERSLEISMERVWENMQKITESILGYVLDYDDHCEEQEAMFRNP